MNDQHNSIIKTVGWPVYIVPRGWYTFLWGVNVLLIAQYFIRLYKKRHPIQWKPPIIGPIVRVLMQIDSKQKLKRYLGLVNQYQPSNWEIIVNLMTIIVIIMMIVLMLMMIVWSESVNLMTMIVRMTRTDQCLITASLIAPTRPTGVRTNRRRSYLGAK